MLDKIYNINCFDGIKMLSDNSVSLVMTSPPYANQRKALYGGILEVEYPNWTTNWMKLIKPKLKENGSIIINIRPHLKNGEISSYVLETRLAIRKDGWKECEELIWIKPDGPPFGRVDRPRRSWESLLWFSKTGDPFCNPKANGQKSKKIGMQDHKGHKIGYLHSGNSFKGEGISKCRDYVEVCVGTSDRSKYNNHPAQYPIKLCEWVIKLLTNENDLVVDIFMGSGTTAIASKTLNRKYVGFEISKEYCEIAERRLSEIKVDPGENLL